MSVHWIPGARITVIVHRNLGWRWSWRGQQQVPTVGDVAARALAVGMWRWPDMAGLAVCITGVVEMHVSPGTGLMAVGAFARPVSFRFGMAVSTGQIGVMGVARLIPAARVVAVEAGAGVMLFGKCMTGQTIRITGMVEVDIKPGAGAVTFDTGRRVVFARSVVTGLTVRKTGVVKNRLLPGEAVMAGRTITRKVLDGSRMAALAVIHPRVVELGLFPADRVVAVGAGASVVRSGSGRIVAALAVWLGCMRECDSLPAVIAVAV